MDIVDIGWTEQVLETSLLAIIGSSSARFAESSHFTAVPCSNPACGTAQTHFYGPFDVCRQQSSKKIRSKTGITLSLAILKPIILPFIHMLNHAFSPPRRGHTKPPCGISLHSVMEAQPQCTLLTIDLNGLSWTVPHITCQSMRWVVSPLSR